MGESRGGGGRAAGPTTVQILRQLIQTYNALGSEVREVRIQHVSGIVFRVEVFGPEIEGSEVGYWTLEELSDLEAAATPSGGDRRELREDSRDNRG